MSDVQEQQLPVVNSAQLDVIGLNLFKKYGDYKKDRRQLEEQWLKNLRQFRGIYDPDIELVLTKDRSRAYPKVTRKKVINTVARLMEMLFPNTETNWSLEPSPIPNLSVEDCQALLDQAGVPPEGKELTMADIEKSIMELAKARCARMSTVISDQLAEIDWVSLARAVIFSGVLYGAGIAKGPLVQRRKESAIKIDPQTKRPIAYEVERLYPFFESMSVFAYYPDLSAKNRKSTDDYFERHVMSRQQVLELADRPDFMGNRVMEFLTENPTGNFKEEWWELMLRTSGDKTNVSNLAGRKYEGAEYWGFVTGLDMQAAGISIAADKLGDTYAASAFLLGGKLVKCRLNPYKNKMRPDHIFVYEDDDINLMGSGLPPVVRDSQMAICESARMALDNGSVVCGPILEINVDLLMPGQSLALHAYKTFLRDDDDRAGVPAVREIKVDSHILELQGLIELFMRFADDETALPPTSTGDITQGGSEAVRTQGNMSMIMSAAALPIRDTVRNFDDFIESVIGALKDWNSQFHAEKASLIGDYQVIPKGSTSLIAKEVRAYALDNFKATCTPDELVYLNPKKFLEERAKARDIPKEVFEADDVVKQKLERQSQDVQRQQAQQEALATAQIRKVLSDAVKNLAMAEQAGVETQVKPFTALMEAINNAAANKPEPSRPTARA